MRVDQAPRLDGPRPLLLTDWPASCLLRLWGLPFPPARLCRQVGEARAAARALGYPLVLKASSPDIPHKTDVGAVRLGIGSDDDLLRAWDEVRSAVAERAPGAHLDGMMLQPMLPKGREVLLGALRDPAFGPVVMVGMGGIHAEVFRDTAIRLAPVSENEALEMLRELRGYPVLAGVRGEPPVDLAALARAVARASRAIAQVPELLELEINPLICYPDGIAAVDGLLRMSPDALSHRTEI